MVARSRRVHLRLLAPPGAYLEASEWIDHADVSIISLARELRAPDDLATAAAAFSWVRDEVRHAGDHRVSPTTCRASDVLAARAGWCFAKAHLLAALLRANGIPAGLAYQRLAFDDVGARFVLHGLVAARLPGIGWHRMDPRGNKPGVEAAFEPPRERLAFVPSAAGEADLPWLHAAPRDDVIECLTTGRTWEDVLARLPDPGPSPALSSEKP